ncbi:hypothetical protein J4526_03825 [Desulfurococcaceae archaeon MEX13E-LK6-19]|nr:hypothetical protein J4526_03825 [Desulfurococcaceae archaeon MEX13E-LK6-19]
MQREIVIIVLNYNGLHALGARIPGKCLRSILETYYENLVTIFVDNGSVDNNVHFVSRYFQNSLTRDN